MHLRHILRRCDRPRHTPAVCGNAVDEILCCFEGPAAHVQKTVLFQTAYLLRGSQSADLPLCHCAEDLFRLSGTLHRIGVDAPFSPGLSSACPSADWIPTRTPAHSRSDPGTGSTSRTAGGLPAWTSAFSWIPAAPPAWTPGLPPRPQTLCFRLPRCPLAHRAAVPAAVSFSAALLRPRR